MPLIEKEVEVMNLQGLHARPAAIFVQIANKYDSKISVRKDGETINGKSIMGILMLGAQHKSKITIIADGEDACEALTELEEFLKKNE
ncbi:MAG TPA: HPr family phosphocarrier protein [Candidatus Omnitrophota bacterium]|nr:HPr family phosphocarrier protein [Candidatus Omnitrophota bacterium]